MFQVLGLLGVAPGTCDGNFTEDAKKRKLLEAFGSPAIHARPTRGAKRTHVGRRAGTLNATNRRD
jgi:hypothetical protein